MSRALIYLLLVFPVLAAAQTDDPAVLPDPTVLPQDATSQPSTPEIQPDKRIFGVLPNYRASDVSIPFQSLTAGQKLTIAVKDSFTWPSYVTAGLFAVLYQLENQNPTFGQGMAGYAKRWATAYGDQMLGNMFQEGIIPALGHQDPRYFRLGHGSIKHRVGYALAQIFVARMDSGKKTFNFSEWGGSAVAAGLSNFYYPGTRDVSDNVQKMVVACATDAFANVGKEFWPDIKHYFHRHHEPKDSN
jgi:hypothetical protein